MPSRQPLQFYSEALPGLDVSGLRGKLIVVEGPDAVGRSTQVAQLRQWLEQEGHAVLSADPSTDPSRSRLAGQSLRDARDTNTLGPLTMTLFHTTDFADRLENEIVPALRAGLVVLTDRYVFSILARALARGEDRKWIEQVAGFALVPHAVYYLRARVGDLVTRVVLGRGTFDYWESGMDLPFGADKHQSFVRYQRRLIQALDSMSGPYDFTIVDASQPADAVFRELQRHISALPFERVELAAVPAARRASKRAQPRATIE
jgi:dTMP kinase